MTSPTVAMGLGRTYASAARKPGLLPKSAGVPNLPDDMDGVDRVVLRFVGLTGDSAASDRDWEYDGDDWSRETLEVVGDLLGERWRFGWRGSSLSSREKTERSSPFQ